MTVNKLIFHHNKYAKKPYPIPQLFTFWNKTGEPDRVYEFIRNLMEYKYEFLVSSPLEHIMTQSGILSIAQVDIHFIGRLKKFKPHLDRLIEHCAHRHLPEVDEILQRMAGFGTMGLDKEPEYTQMMGLELYVDGDVLPAAKAVADSYEAYQALVDFYRQDFICFGYEHDYIKFKEKIYRKLEQDELRDPVAARKVNVNNNIYANKKKKKKTLSQKV